MKPETGGQIAIYGIKLHLNVHIFSVKRGNKQEEEIRCLQNVPQMNYSCSVHVILIHRKISRLKLEGEICIKFLTFLVDCKNSFDYINEGK